MDEHVILVIASNPDGTDPLKLDKEIEAIRTALRGSKHREQIRLEPVLSSKQQKILDAVLDHRPTVVQFSGHGTKTSKLVFETDGGQPHLVEADVLGPFFQVFSEHVRCVVLNACYTLELATAIGEHVDYVIGVEKGLPDPVAIQFAATFYSALGGGQTIENAYALGVNAIAWAKYNVKGGQVPTLRVAARAASQPEAAPLSKADWFDEVIRLFHSPQAAKALLSRLEFPPGRLPLFGAEDAFQFWFEVRKLIRDGVKRGLQLEDVLRVAHRQYPGNEVFIQALESKP